MWRPKILAGMERIAPFEHQCVWSVYSRGVDPEAPITQGVENVAVYATLHTLRELRWTNHKRTYFSRERVATLAAFKRAATTARP